MLVLVKVEAPKFYLLSVFICVGVSDSDAYRLLIILGTLVGFL